MGWLEVRELLNDIFGIESFFAYIVVGKTFGFFFRFWGRSVGIGLWEGIYIVYVYIYFISIYIYSYIRVFIYRLSRAWK